jgi:hypothetical protein
VKNHELFEKLEFTARNGRSQLSILTTLEAEAEISLQPRSWEQSGQPKQASEERERERGKGEKGEGGKGERGEGGKGGRGEGGRGKGGKREKGKKGKEKEGRKEERKKERKKERKREGSLLALKLYNSNSVDQ